MGTTEGEGDVIRSELEKNPMSTIWMTDWRRGEILMDWTMVGKTKWMDSSGAHRCWRGKGAEEEGTPALNLGLLVEVRSAWWCSAVS